MPVDKLAIVMENEPVPVPLLAQVANAVVGFAVVSQQTPRVVTDAPPSDVTLPPLAAELIVMPLIMVVRTVGATGAASVVNGTSLPYAVPTELVAYARTWYAVLAVSPLRALTKDPMPEPLLAHVPDTMVGFAAVLQQTPLAVTDAPPSDVTLPPLEAAVIVIPVIAVVVSVGATGAGMVANDKSLPYPVPAELVANALTWYVVTGVNPVMELIKEPGPVPSLEQGLAVVGFAVVLQQTPLAVIDAPPSDVTLPPLAAATCVIPVIVVVVTVGKLADDEKVKSLPYDVPTELVAYART